MVTIFRWFMLKQERVKWKLAFYKLLDALADEFGSGGGGKKLEDRLMPFIARAIHEAAGADSGADAAPAGNGAENFRKAAGPSVRVDVGTSGAAGTGRRADRQGGNRRQTSE